MSCHLQSHLGVSISLPYGVLSCCVEDVVPPEFVAFAELAMTAASGRSRGTEFESLANITCLKRSNTCELSG